MSLKNNLQQIIKDRNGGIVSIDEIADYCKKAGFKLSNAERRLRPSDSPGIQRVFKKGYIIGYKYEKNSEKENFTEQTEKVKIPSNTEKRQLSMREMRNYHGSISGPYISHRPIPKNGMDNH